MTGIVTHLGRCPTCGQHRHELPLCLGCPHPRVSHDERGRCMVALGPAGLRCLCRDGRLAATDLPGSGPDDARLPGRVPLSGSRTEEAT